MRILFYASHTGRDIKTVLQSDLSSEKRRIKIKIAKKPKIAEKKSIFQWTIEKTSMKIILI